MNSPTAYRESQFPYKILLFLAGFTFMLVWLPLLRCLMDGASYSWGMTFFGHQFRSVGIMPDYWFLVFQLVFFGILFYAFFWVKNRIVFYSLLIVWFIQSFGNLLFEVIKNGDTMFHGDTLGVHLSLASVLVPLSIIALGLISWVILKDRQQEEKAIIWNRRNRLWAILILAPLPLQFILFSTGEPHGITDQIGVLIAIAQALLIPFIFIPQPLKSLSETD